MVSSARAKSFLMNFLNIAIEISMKHTYYIKLEDVFLSKERKKAFGSKDQRQEECRQR